MPIQAPAELGLPHACRSHGLIKGQLGFGQRRQNHEVPALSTVGGRNVAAIFDVPHESCFHSVNRAPQFRSSLPASCMGRTVF